MATYRLGASISGTAIPFITGTEFQFESNHTLQLQVACTPTHPGTIGWFPGITASGYCLPGAALPTCSLTILNNNLEPIPNLPLPEVSLIEDPLYGRFTLGYADTTLRTLSVASLGSGVYQITGTLPQAPTWVRLRVTVYENTFELPLWPVGCPVYLLESLPTLTGAPYSSDSFISNLVLTPYLSKFPHTQSCVKSAGCTPSFMDLSDPVDPASFFIQTAIPRSRYNAITLKEGGATKCFLEPVWDPATSSYALSVLSGLQETIGDDTLSLGITASAPILYIQGSAISNAFDTTPDATHLGWSSNIFFG